MTSPNNNMLLGVVTGAVITTIALGVAAATVRQKTKIPFLLMRKSSVILIPKLETLKM
jgi:hypothetical protein